MRISFHPPIRNHKLLQLQIDELFSANHRLLQVHGFKDQNELQTILEFIDGAILCVRGLGESVTVTSVQNFISNTIDINKKYQVHVHAKRYIAQWEKQALKISEARLNELLTKARCLAPLKKYEATI